MNRREKNILLVSLENLENGIPSKYYCSSTEGEPMFCHSIMNAEVTTKYVFSKVKVDEVVVIGSGATYDEGDDLRKISLKEGHEYFSPDLNSLSEYSLYRYRIHAYLDGLDLEEYETLADIHPEEKDRILDIFNKFYREVSQRTARKKKKDVFFSSIYKEPELFEELIERLPEDLKKKSAWLKAYIYSIMTDFYKLRPLEANEDVLISFIPTTTSKENAIDISNLTKIIEILIGDENELVNLYIDMQGLVRTDDFTMVTVLSILKNEWRNKIQVKEILSTSTSGFAYEIKNEYARYELNNLLAGMNAFIQYGKVGSLQKYWDELGIYDDHVERLFLAMQYIDDGVSLCNIADLEFGIKELRNVLSEERSNVGKHLESNIISVLETGIRRDFGVLLEETKDDSIDVLELIKWAYRKEFYQQTLTIMESRIPNDFVKRGVLYYAENEKDKKHTLKILGKAYKKAIPKDRYQFNHINHYFIKFYCRQLINYKQDPIKVQQDYAKLRVEQIGIHSPNHLRSYSLLEPGKDLEELLFSYYNIGRIRNQVSHGVSSAHIYPGQRKLRRENDTIRILRDAVEHFIELYEATKETLKDKEPSIVTVTSEELKQHHQNRPKTSS